MEAWRGGRGHRAMVNMGLKRREERLTRRLQYIHTGISSALEISIAHGRAPPICLVRADAFRSPSTPGQARETTICYGSALLRQCAQALDGVSTGRRSRTCFETKLPLSCSRRIPDRHQLAAVPVHASRGHGCLPRLMQAPKLPLKLECCSERRPS